MQYSKLEPRDSLSNYVSILILRTMEVMDNQLIPIMAMPTTVNNRVTIKEVIYQDSTTTKVSLHRSTEIDIKAIQTMTKNTSMVRHPTLKRETVVTVVEDAVQSVGVHPSANVSVASAKLLEGSIDLFIQKYAAVVQDFFEIGTHSLFRTV